MNHILLYGQAPKESINELKSINYVSCADIVAGADMITFTAVTGSNLAMEVLAGIVTA
jgi:hypothetical protein